MRKIGSQTREVLPESGMYLYQRLNRREVLLKMYDADSSALELWIENDDFAGYVIEINGKRYEFAREVRGFLMQ